MHRANVEGVSRGGLSVPLVGDHGVGVGVRFNTLVHTVRHRAREIVLPPTLIQVWQHLQSDILFCK